MSGTNYGIVGNVQASAVAVGAGARAIADRPAGPVPREAFDAALKALQEQIAQLSISHDGLDALKADVDQLRALSTQPAPSPDRAASLLDALIGKLKMVGVAVEAATPLAGPIKAIAALCGVALPF